MSTPAVDAIIVTFERPESLVECLQSALAQTVSPRSLVVVDNGSPPLARSAIADAQPSSTDLRVLHPGANLGPAGGYSAGFAHLRERVGNLDWVLLLDDDDPLPAPDIVERLVDAGRAAEGPVGGVGLMGAIFRPRLLLPAPIDVGAGGLVAVDSLHGWAAPLYRAAAVEQVGGFRS